MKLIVQEGITASRFKRLTWQSRYEEAFLTAGQIQMFRPDLIVSVETFLESNGDGQLCPEDITKIKQLKEGESFRIGVHCGWVTVTAIQDKE